MINSDLHNDKELFDLIAAGDHNAFKSLLDRHRSNVYGHALAFLKDAFRAQDVVQEVFLSIWNQRHALASVEDPENYLFIIARNKIITEFRKKMPLPILDSIEQIYVTTDRSPDEQAERKQLMSFIQAAINQLPPQRKMVFELGKKDGLKYEEIAGLLNISPHTVKVHMVQALAFIRQFIRNQVTILLFFTVFI